MRGRRARGEPMEPNPKPTPEAEPDIKRKAVEPGPPGGADADADANNNARDANPIPQKTPTRPRVGAGVGVGAAAGPGSGSTKPAPGSASRQMLSPGKMIIRRETPDRAGRQGHGQVELASTHPVLNPFPGGSASFMTPRSALYSSAAASAMPFDAQAQHEQLIMIDDSEEDIRFVEAALRKLPRADLVGQAREMEEWAYRLGLEETTEMQRGRAMNVLAASVPAPMSGSRSGVKRS